jgi:hypothetical protein
MQNFPLALVIVNFFDTPCPSSKPMDVASTTGICATLDSLGFYEIILLDDLLEK